MMKRNKGFTLIELLVVIAIIGVLASVVLASLNSARDKGANAAAISSINNMRTQAELFYDDNGNVYTGICTAGSVVMQGVTAASDATGLTSDCADSDTAYALEVELRDTEGFYCVDSTGAATTTLAGNGSTIADGSDYVCG